MLNYYVLPAGAMATLLLLVPLAPVQGQTVTLTTISPAANARAVPRNAPVVATFSRPLTAGSSGGLQVHAMQHGGLRTAATPAVVSGSTLSFAPVLYPFAPGEQVQATVTRAAASSTGSLANPRVVQFTAAVSGPGRGYFQAVGQAATAPTSGYTTPAVADLDGDGDLDLITTQASTTTINVALNNGLGQFTAAPSLPSVAGLPYSLTLGDVDGDGDLDLLSASRAGGGVSLRLNNGAGVFTAPVTGAELPMGIRPHSLALGDVDADGDLDLVVANDGSATVSLRLNDGTGLFAAPVVGAEIAVGNVPYSVALADVNNDGTLDIMVTSAANHVLCLRLNDGTGTFTARPANPDVAINDLPASLTVGDVDGDNDVDFLVSLSISPGRLGMFLNDGQGHFTAGPAPLVGAFVNNIALGDVDSDGDLDLLTPNYTQNAVSIRLNQGTGLFALPASGAEVALGTSVNQVALADVDGDGDLDALAVYGGVTTVCLNQAQPLATTPGTAPAALIAFPNPATGQVQLRLPPAATRAELLDALGRTLRTVPATAGLATLDVAGLAPGLYVVRAAGQVARLVVE